MPLSVCSWARFAARELSRRGHRELFALFHVDAFVSKWKNGAAPHEALKKAS
jgi:hypothetical protein